MGACRTTIVGLTMLDEPHADIANMLATDYASTFNPNDLPTAQKHIDLLLEKQPNDPETHLAIANLNV